MATDVHERIFLDAVERWNAGEREETINLATRDVAIHSALTKSIFRGHDGLRRWWSEIDDQFARWALTVDEFKAADDDRLLALGRLHARGRGSGVALEQPVAWMCAFEGDRLAEIWIYMDHAEALRAGGLT